MSDQQKGEPEGHNLVSIPTGKHVYQLGELLAHGDMADLYRCLYSDDGLDCTAVFKIARDAADNDLLANEARQLEYLWSDARSPAFHCYLPQLIDSFPVPQEAGEPRRANVLNMPDGYYSLAEVRRAYPEGVDPRHMAWMFNRLLEVLGYLHGRGVIHGAVLPTHALIHPETHALLLIDWGYSVRPARGEHIGAVSTAYEAWYPPEVWTKRPPLPATDIYMAAGCMMEVLGGNPLTGELPAAVPGPIRRFLETCRFRAPASRPPDAWRLREEFDAVLQSLFGPRAYCHFEMPRR